jgi:hypothetical protein
MATKAKSTRATTAHRQEVREKVNTISRSPAQEAEALDKFKRLMEKYRGKCSFEGCDE